MSNNQRQTSGRLPDDGKSDFSSLSQQKRQQSIQSTPKSNYSRPSKESLRDEQGTPLLSVDSEINLFDTRHHHLTQTPLFSTQMPGHGSNSKIQYPPGYTNEVDPTEPSSNYLNVNIIPNISRRDSQSTLKFPLDGGEPGGFMSHRAHTDPQLAHMISPNPDPSPDFPSRQLQSRTNSGPVMTSKNMSNWQAIKRMVGRMAPEKGKIIVGVSAMMVGSLATLVLPLLIGKLVDIVAKPEAKFSDVHWVIYIAIISIILQAIANFIQLSTLLVAGDKVVAVLRLELFKALIYRDISFFDTVGVGELLSRLSTDVNAINHALTIDIAEGFQRVALMGGSIVYMLYISYDMCAIVFLLAPIIGVSASRLARLFHRYAAQVNTILALSTTIAQETLANMRTVRSLGLEYTQQLRYNETIINSYKGNRKQKLMRAGQRTFVYFAAGCAVIGVLWYGAWKVIQKQLTSGSLLTFIIMGLNVGQNIGQMLDNYTNISTSAAACSEALDLVDSAHSHNQLYADYKELTPWHSTTNDVDFDEALKKQGKESKTDLTNSRRDNTGRLVDHCTVGTTLILDDSTIPILPKINFNVPITFDNIHFTYPSRPGQPVLNGVTFTIAPFSENGFVGSSGSGKSSAMSLLLQMYDVDCGKIKLGDTDIADINPVLWRSAIAYVEQHPTLFNTSIIQNVLMGVSNYKLHDCDYTMNQLRLERENLLADTNLTGTPGLHISHINDVETGSTRSNRKDKNSPRRSSADLSDDVICTCRTNPDLPLCQDLFGRKYTMRDVEHACRMANAHEFILELDDGYHTLVSGVSLSGGQAQRLSIARALIRNAQLILFDEVSSALDPINEEAIMSAIKNLVQGKTVITIAHRLSTIKHLGQTNPNDTIFVFKGGNIVEKGTHQELMSIQDGEFKLLQDLQALVTAAQAA